MTFTPPITRRNHGRGHSYRDANGQRVPGVTTIISKGVPKPALVTWAASKVAECALDRWDELGALAPSERLKVLKKAPNADRDAAAVRGTKVHAIAVRLEAGEEVAVPDELAGHVTSYVRFLDEWNPTSLLVEAPVVSYAHGYAGTLDLIAEMAGLRWLLDIKTSRSGVYGETALQLAPYRYADVYLDPDGKEHPVPAVDRAAVVWVRADGYDVVPVEAGPDQFRAFLYAAQVAAFTEGARDLVGEPLDAPVVAA